MRPAVSVDVGGPGLASGDLDFPLTFQPNPSLDDKPLESLFDFEQFDDPVGPSPSLLDNDVPFTPALFGGLPNVPGFDFSDQYDAKHFEMQTASGAAFASDETFAA